MQTQARSLLLTPNPMNSTTHRLAHVAQYINKHLRRALSVRELADQACMSEPNFYRTFRQTFGLTPVEYINQQRIALAGSLLRNTNRGITDICLDCGFNSLTYFTTLFRREVGMPPAQYRRQTPALG